MARLSLRDSETASCPGNKNGIDRQRRPCYVVIIQIAFNENTNSKFSLLSTPHGKSVSMSGKNKISNNELAPSHPAVPALQVWCECASTNIRLLAGVSTPFTTRFEHGFGSPRCWCNVVLYGIIRTEKLSTNSVSFARAHALYISVMRRIFTRISPPTRMTQFNRWVSVFFFYVARTPDTFWRKENSKNKNVSGAVLFLLHYVYVHTRIHVHSTSTVSIFSTVKQLRRTDRKTRD